MAESIINNFVCEMWVSGGYSAPLFVGYKAGKALSNALYATDDTIAQFCKMGALSDYEWLIKRTVEMERSKFNADSSDYNAKVLLNSIEVMYNVLDLSCDFAIEFSDIIYEGGAINIFGQNDQKHADFVNSCNKMRSYARESYNRFNDLYLLELEGDYPDVFASLVKQKDFYARYVPVTGIEWDIDDIEVGLEDTYVLFFNAKVVPDNATNKEIIYSSSNPEVAICSSAGIDYFQPGTTVITASTLEGDYSESITVSVVEGHGANGTVLEPTIIKEPVIGDVFEFEGVKYTITSSTEATVSGRTSNSSNYMNIPEKVAYKEKEYRVTSISNYAFKNDKTLSYVIMPDTIKWIGSYAFYSCYNLKSVRLSSKITSILRDCFFGSGIETLIIPEGVTSIEIEAFSISSSLKTIYLPSTLETIGDGAFFGCDNLQDVCYAGSKDDLKKVKFGTLNSPLNTASYSYNVTFPDRWVVSSGSCGDTATYSLTYDGLLSIEGTGKLGGWTSSISNNGSQYVVKYNLPWSRFGDIITNLYIGKDITNVPSSIFTVGTIESIDVDVNNSNYKTIDGVLFDKSGKTLLCYPDGKKNHVYFVPEGANEIGSSSIVNNSNLSNLIIPDGVTKISSSSIQNCENLKYITIPNTLTDIESGSFSKISDYRLILSEGFTELTKE